MKTFNQGFNRRRLPGRAAAECGAGAVHAHWRTTAAICRAVPAIAAEGRDAP